MHPLTFSLWRLSLFYYCAVCSGTLYLQAFPLTPEIVSRYICPKVFQFFPLSGTIMTYFCRFRHMQFDMATIDAKYIPAFSSRFYLYHLLSPPVFPLSIPSLLRIFFRSPVAGRKTLCRGPAIDSINDCHSPPSHAIIGTPQLTIGGYSYDLP